MKPKTAAELAATLRAQVEADAAERLRAGMMCGGCGVEAKPGAEGWRRADAPWCPKCAWLA
jgi:hypothetical protein